MNVVQALAVAAAALAVSGAPSRTPLAQAEARLEAMVARGEALAEHIVAKHSQAPRKDCPEDDRAGGGARGLPDTSIHAAMRSARM